MRYDWSDDWSWSDWDWTGHWDEWCDQSWTDYGDWSYSEPSAQHLASPPNQTAQWVQAPVTASGTVSTVTGFPNTGTIVSSNTTGTLQSVSPVSTPLKPRAGPGTGSFGGAFVSTIAALSVLGTTEGTSVATVVHPYRRRETGCCLIQEQQHTVVHLSMLQTIHFYHWVPIHRT